MLKSLVFLLTLRISLALVDWFFDFLFTRTTNFMDKLLDKTKTKQQYEILVAFTVFLLIIDGIISVLITWVVAEHIYSAFLSLFIAFS